MVKHRQMIEKLESTIFKTPNQKSKFSFFQQERADLESIFIEQISSSYSTVTGIRKSIFKLSIEHIGLVRKSR